MRTSLYSLIAFASLAVFEARAAQISAGATGNWSNPATWVGGVLPGVEDTVKIPTGLTVTLNTDVECGGIVVEGKLTVERADRTLLCDYLLVQTTGAVFEVGTNANRFAQNFTLTLKGLSTESPMGSMGAKLLGAHNGGTLDLHGKDRIEWTHLGVNAAAGATSLTLSEAVDWTVGDSILVTSSRASWNEAETRTITAISPDLRTVSFATGLTYLHNGSTITKTRSTDGKSWTGDLRAEVGLLSRNVKIQGDPASETAGFGGHIMVMNGGTTCCVTNGRAFIEGVELFRMGQKSIIGRYPMHWHMVAEGGVGQYFRDNVVRRSFNRAITIHGTESTLVENNFCYDHLGHGIFLEDGSERFNIFRKNVVALSKKPAAGEELLETDNGFNVPQNRSPSSYWITNPNNTFTDNVAAGTEGTGYWFAFPLKPLGASLTHPRFSAMEPFKQPLGAFDRNTAHSSMMGMDINDQVAADDTLIANGEWANNGPFYFKDCTWYSNDNAVYAGIGNARKNVVYRNNVFSDNEINLFLATYHLCEESLMVADSGYGLQPSTQTRTVYQVYDGAGRMTNNHLVGYDATNARFLDNIGGAIKHPNHYFQGLTFEPAVPVRSVLPNYNFIPPPNIAATDSAHPRRWAMVIRDVDGSISGVSSSSIVSNHPFLLTGGETRPSVWTNMYRSDHHFAQCLLDYNLAFGSIPNVSVVRTKAGTPTRGIYYINGYNEWHQLPLIVREDYLYTYTYESLPSTKKVIVNLNDAEPGDNYVVRFKDFGKLAGVAVTGMTSRTSLAALKSGTTSGFFKETNGDFYIRPVATATNHTYTITWTTNITLPVVDSDGDGVSDGAEAAAGTDPFRTVDGTEPFLNSEFEVAGNFENWDSFSGIGSETVTGGTIGGVSTTTTPQMQSKNLRVSGSQVPWLLVRMKASVNGNAKIRWGVLGDSTYPASRIITVNYNGGNTWRVVAFPMSANAEWLGQLITNLRFDPASSSGTTFEIDWIRASDGNFFSTPATQTTDVNTALTDIPVTLSPDLAPHSSFVLSGASSNTALVPNANIVFGGSGAARTVSVTPAANKTGTATITMTVTDGTLTSTTSFLLSVTPANAAPTISHVTNQIIDEDTATAALAFTVGDAETPAASLTVSASSSDTTLVPNANIVLGGTGAARTVTVTPAANQNGSAIITLTVSDGAKTASDTFLLTVNAVNDAPSISDVAAQTTSEDTATAALAFTIGDVETVATSLTVSGTSSNTALVPNANIVFGGNGATRTVTITPSVNQFGTTTITLMVSDGSLAATDTLLLTVNAVNDAPTISNIANQTLALSSSTGAIPFTISDPETAASSLQLSVASSNLTLVPLSSIVLDGSAGARTITISPAQLEAGTSTITLTVSDGVLTGSAIFVVTVDESAFGRFAYVFNQDGNFEGWVANSHTSGAAVSGGALSATLINPDPQFNHSAAVNVAGSNVPVVLIRMKSSVGGNAQLFFGNELGGVSAANSVNFAVSAGSVFKWYAVNVAANNNWTGHTIKALRLDPPGATGTMSVDAIIGSDGDFNQDGIPDGWAVANQLDPTALADLLRDSDGDGFTDSAEYVLGTNPGAGTTALLSTGTVGANITLTFTAAAATGTGYSGLSRIYDVETTTDLGTAASWIPLAGYANITGANQTVVVTQPLTDGPRFYRLKVRLQ